MTGRFGNAGSVQVGTTTTGGTALLAVTDTGVLHNAGMLNVASGYGRTGPDVTGSNLTNAGLMTNSGVVTLQGGFASYYNIGYGAQLTNTGSLVNTGSIAIDGGRGGFYGGGYGSGATLTTAGVLRNAGSIAVGAGGFGFRAAPGGSGVLIDRGTMFNSGVLGLAGGSGYIESVAADSAMIDVSGVLDNAGMIAVAAGYSYANTGYYGNGGLLSVSGALANDGTIAVAGQMTVGNYGGGSAGNVLDSGLLINRDLITLGSATGTAQGAAAALTVTATGVLIDYGTIIGGGALHNSGIIFAGGNGSGAIDTAQFINGGAVNVGTGAAFTIGGPVAADAARTGSFTLSSYGSLSLLGTVSASQTVDFNAHSALALGDAAGFAGILAGLQDHTVIDFLALDVTSATSTGTVLDIGVSGGTTLDLTLAAPLATGLTLTLATDHNGGTDLLFGHG